MLRQHDLFPGNLWNELQAMTKCTQEVKNQCFLDKAIEAFLNHGDHEPLEKLLEVMNDERNNMKVKNLGAEIKQKLHLIKSTVIRN